MAGTGSDTACQTTGTATCNGDGDGSMLDVISGTTYPSYEMFRFWQHLANAGLIEGQYNGIITAVNTYTLGVNVPATKMTNVLFGVKPGLGYTAEGGSTAYAGSTTYFSGDYGKNIFLIGQIGAAVTIAGSQPLRPEKAYNIDKKMDDGMPGTGMVVGGKGNGTNTSCTSNAGGAPSTDAGATYLLSNTSKDCWLLFPKVF